MERGNNVTLDTRFRIASISKLVTTIGLLHLYERKFFSLDDDISLKLGFNLRNPNFPEDKITYKMLLSHMSSF
jgi:CubicO group peptidase (beta-lactamase class C family)